MDPQVRTTGLFLTKIHFQEDYTMKTKRITSLILALVLALTLTAEIYAQTNDTGNMETKERISG